MFSSADCFSVACNVELKKSLVLNTAGACQPDKFLSFFGGFCVICDKNKLIRVAFVLTTELKDLPLLNTYKFLRFWWRGGKLGRKVNPYTLLAQLVERQSAVQEVKGSSSRPDQHSGS